MQLLYSMKEVHLCSTCSLSQDCKLIYITRQLHFSLKKIGCLKTVSKGDINIILSLLPDYQSKKRLLYTNDIEE